MSNIQNEIKILLIQRNLTMTDLTKIINEKYDRSYTLQNLSKKLSKGTIRFSEIKEIAEVLEYRLAWIPNDLILDAGKEGVIYSPK